MSRQGSASFTIVIGSLTAMIVGAIVLTMMFYPIINAFMDAAFWNTNSVAGNRVTTYTGGVWVFWGAIVMLAILSYVWIQTRQ